MAQPQANLSNLFTDLQRFGQNEEWDRALKTANKILQETPGDGKVLQCKIVCFLQQGKFEEALSVIHKNGELANSLPFEKAYCEYRLNRTKEALKTLRAVENPDERISELLGQVLYRLEELEECFDVYKDLMKNTQDDYEEERETNLAAVMAALQATTDGEIEDLGLREDSYEMCYNRACYLLGQGRYKDAIEKLAKSEELCRASLEEMDDAPEDEMDAELGVIRTQRGYALQKLGKDKEALQLYNTVIKSKPTDVALNAVTSNNIVTINKDQNVFDSKKKIKAATADGLQHKLTSAQQEEIALNHCLLYMYIGQSDKCHSTAASLQKSLPDSEKPCLIRAAQYCRDKQTAKAIDCLQSALSGGGSVGMKLTVAQLHLGQGAVYKACDVLRNLGDYTYRPGVVSSLVTLFLSQEDYDSASDVLNDSVAWYQKNEPGSDNLVRLMRYNSNFQLRHGDPKVATDMLEELRKRDPTDLKILAQLIFAYSKFDPKKAQLVSRELPSPDEISADVDVDALEASVTVLGHRYRKTAAKGDISPNKPLSPKSGDVIVDSKNKKKKKVRLPKNYEAGTTPDEERWLPLRERSYYRGKRRKNRKEGIGKGTQGAVSGGATDQLDASRPAAVSPTPGATEVPSPKAEAAKSSGATASSGAPRGQKQSGKQKKKKGRKGGW